jgi:hypothetical protein
MPKQAPTITMNDTDSLIPYVNNARTHSQEQINQIAASIKEFGFINPVIIDGDKGIIAGHGRVQAAQKLGMAEVPCVQASHLTEAQKKAYILADNKLALNAGWDDEILRLELQALDDLDFDLELTGFDLEEITQAFDLEGDHPHKHDPSKVGCLAREWGVVPTSIFDTRSGEWRNRRLEWLDTGLNSAQGRGELPETLEDFLIALKSSKAKAVGPAIEIAIPNYYTMKSKGYTDEQIYEKHKKSGLASMSIFDPVLCETLINWYSPEKGHVLDPFAGGGTRGIVSGMLGRDYTGIDIRAEQVDANRDQIMNPPFSDMDSKVTWITGDSANIDSLTPEGQMYDFLLTCPPYADLEVYSDDPSDISNMSYPDFINAYNIILKKSIHKIKDDSFIAVVVGEVRDNKTGYYRNFVRDTIAACVSAGASFYNESILINGTGAVRFTLNKTFKAARKVGKVHQNVLIFVKGCPKKATAKLSPVNLPELTEDDSDEL